MSSKRSKVKTKTLRIFKSPPLYMFINNLAEKNIKVPSYSKIISNQLKGQLYCFKNK